MGAAPANIIGKRMRARRLELGLSQEDVGVRVGLDESASRARISRYELGTHEPPVETARLIAEALGVPLAYLYCDQDELGMLLKELGTLPTDERQALVSQWLTAINGMTDEL